MQGTMTMLLVITVIGQVADQPKEEGWQPIFQRMAEDYVIQSIGDSPRTFELRKTPILRWSQPVRGGDDGATFVWLDRGRPAAIGNIFAYPNADQSRTIVHEFHSLAPQAINAAWGNKLKWQPPKAGITLADLPDAPAPAEKPAARLTQMRAMLREFTARSIDAKDQPWELRLMSQPLVRYEPNDRSVLFDGAVFAFAQGTDPEILFVVEAQRDKQKSVWKYGCGRFSDYRLELKHKEQLVWSVGQTDYSERNGVYFATSVEVRQAPAGATELKGRKPTETNQE